MTHVLIVDDQALNRILLEKMLLEENYKISIAFNGLEALEVLEKEAILQVNFSFFFNSTLWFIILNVFTKKKPPAVRY